MRTKISDKFLAIFTGIILSLVSAYYAIAGLTIIFAAAFWPIIIMGTTLEVGKIITASYLYRNWNNIPILMKSYFTVAVAILMFITSIGVFGYLSAAHTDRASILGDVQSKVNIYDEKIKVSKDNLDINRKVLRQMDDSVDQVMARSSSEQSVERAVQIRRQQAKERSRILAEIEAEQKTISRLNDEKAPIASEIRKAEAEVGPIKYVAELLYGESSTELLEKSVRFMIIALVLVLDPLALLLIISANINYSLKSKKINSSKKYSLDARRWFRSNANAVATDGKIWKEMPDVTVTKTKK